MTILVTGSAGHLGEALMRMGRARGLPMRSLDLVASDWTDDTGDIADRETLARAAEGATAILHTATLHKPHVATHDRAAFLRTNVEGTAAVLATARALGGIPVIFTSTTSTFGHALRTAPGEPAAWIDEDVVPQVKNVYGETKLMAEALCEEAANAGQPVVILRTSRFFPEPDDDPARRAAYPGDNLHVVELLYRRVDIEDAAQAHFDALDRAASLGFGRYIISAPPPFRREDCPELGRNLASIMADIYPEYKTIFATMGWRLPDRLDRVYDPSRAIAALDWQPRYTFKAALDRVATGAPPMSLLAREIGIKGYHGPRYRDGLYPV
jgi:UDP-glucose 4-epimerase